MHRPSRLILLASLAAGGLLAVGAGAANAAQTFHATLNAQQEAPPVDSKGTGTAEFTLDPATKMLTWTVTYTGLSGPATAAHIHGPAAPGANAGVAINLAPNGAQSPIKGSATLTDAQIADLSSGKDYVNVHTAANKGGEIRGQITP